ncbi:MAG: hypothetical protein KDA83_16915 [Planctomycetales bacterium]|nr:hypothetical protein [Planctomycetales bacterium]
MSDDDQLFGARLYAELRKLSGYDLITGIMDYKAIQQLKAADREGTVKLFRGSSFEVTQLLRTAEPEEAARYFVTKATEAKQDSNDLLAAISLMISSL